MDEVLAIWVARLHSAQAVVSALFHGSEFAPPTYDLLLHALTTVTSGSYRAFRLPSMFAILVSGLCMFVLIRRYFDVRAAAFGFALSIMGALSSYALEIRPYALVVLCFAFAMLFWDRLDGSRHDLWRIGCLTLCLAGATALHFYGVLFVPCVALMELLWSGYHRRLRLPVWFGLFAAGCSSFMWLPLIKALSRYNSGDTGGTGYYARPTLDKLSDTYAFLFMSDRKQVLFLAVTFCFTAIAYAFKEVRASADKTLEPSQNRRGISAANFYIIAFCTIVFPTLVYIFALFGTRTFNTRYCLIVCFGYALLTASVVSRLSAFRSAAMPILLTGCALLFFDPIVVGSSPITSEIADVLASATKPYPIVVGEGLQYFQLAEGLPDQLKSRLVYVTAPAGVKSPDPTNENQVKRWIPLRPDLKIIKAENFLAQNPHFYVLHTTDSTDVLTNWLVDQSMIEKTDRYTGRIWLFEAGLHK